MVENKLFMKMLTKTISIAYILFYLSVFTVLTMQDAKYLGSDTLFKTKWIIWPTAFICTEVLNQITFYWPDKYCDKVRHVRAFILWLIFSLASGIYMYYMFNTPISSPETIAKYSDGLENYNRNLMYFLFNPFMAVSLTYYGFCTDVRFLLLFGKYEKRKTYGNKIGICTQDVSNGQVCVQEQMEIKTPITITDADKGTDFFKSVDDAINYLEPYDVLNNELFGYDAEGRLLTVKVNDPNLDPWDRKIKIIIEQAEEEPTHQDDLRRKIIDYFDYLETNNCKGWRKEYESGWYKNASLEELTSEILKNHCCKV